jgi:hypothetical protein
MAAKKANSYISAELDWAEAKLLEWRMYIDNNPIHELKDRMDYKEMKNGGMMRTVTASIEQQIKSVQDTMKNYLALLEVVDKLREREEQKVQLRGDAEVNGMMGRLKKAE